MSSAILDMQFVLGADNKYFIKEMSIVNTETWASQHWIFKNSKTMQDNKSRKTNKWLEHNYHKLTIEYGDVEYEELSRIISSLCIYKKYTLFYLHYTTKKKYLQSKYITLITLFNKNMYML
jgi:hypothetical protein